MIIDKIAQYTNVLLCIFMHEKIGIFKKLMRTGRRSLKPPCSYSRAIQKFLKKKLISHLNHEKPFLLHHASLRTFLLRRRDGSLTNTLLIWHFWLALGRFLLQKKPCNTRSDYLPVLCQTLQPL